MADAPLYALATRQGWVIWLTCRVDCSPSGSEVGTSPGDPMCSGDPSPHTGILTRQTREGIERARMRCANWFDVEIVELTQIEEADRG